MNSTQSNSIDKSIVNTRPIHFENGHVEVESDVDCEALATVISLDNPAVKSAKMKRGHFFKCICELASKLEACGNDEYTIEAKVFSGVSDLLNASLNTSFDCGKVKWVLLEDGTLLITDMSCGSTHGIGVADLIVQTGSWCEGSRSMLNIKSDSIIPLGSNMACAPDVVLTPLRRLFGGQALPPGEPNPRGEVILRLSWYS